MHHIVFQEDIDYEDLGDAIPVELKLIGAWLYVETPVERVAVNDSALRYDGIPKNVLEYVLENNGKNITIFHLQDAGIRTSRDLRQIAIRAGIKGYVRDIFMPVSEKYQIKILNKVTLRPQEVEALIESLI